MKKIFGFSPEETSEELEKKAKAGTLKLKDRFDFFGDWLLNIERRLRIIERDLKAEYPEDEPK